MTAEVRARTLTGRDQISDDGRHLVDGVPFGRPYLRHPNRPAVRIPPRKRRRIDDAGEGAEEARLLTENGETSSPHKHNGKSSDEFTSAGFEEDLQARRVFKSVQFLGDELDEDEDSDEDDDDFAPGGEEDDVAMDDSAKEHSDSDTDSSSNSDTSSDEESGLDSDSTDSSSDSDNESDASSPPEVRSSKGIPDTTTVKKPSSPGNVAPGHGRPGTHRRNNRRMRMNRLRYLKEAGKLPPDADLQALGEYETGVPTVQPCQPQPSHPFSLYAGKRKRIDEDEATEDTELEQRKQELMARFDNDTDGTTVPAPPHPQEPMMEEQSAKKESPKKRLRPDTSAIGRILARQAMPSKRQPKTKAAVEKTPEPEGASEPDFWKSRINLSAFECWEEEFELTAPPFPFEQHWDPACKAMRKKAEAKRHKKGGKKQQPSTPAKLQQEEDEEERIYLDYDDTGATEDPDFKITAAIEDQLRQDVAAAEQSDLPTLPALPDDMTTLPDLSSADIKIGAVIACKFFDVNLTTMCPEISNYKTAVIHREGDSGNGAGTLCLKIAERDLPKREKKFDSKGNRIYDAADQFYVEDEDEETGLWEGQLAELLEPKLVKAA